MILYFLLQQLYSCGNGGTGRRTGFRFQRVTVQVQVLFPAPLLNFKGFCASPVTADDAQIIFLLGYALLHSPF